MDIICAKHEKMWKNHKYYIEVKKGTIDYWSPITCVRKKKDKENQIKEEIRLLQVGQL